MLGQGQLLFMIAGIAIGYFGKPIIDQIVAMFRKTPKPPPIVTTTPKPPIV